MAGLGEAERGLRKFAGAWQGLSVGCVTSVIHWSEEEHQRPSKNDKSPR